VVIRRVLSGFLVVLLLGAGALANAPDSAAQSGLPCGVDAPPDDGFASAAFGLTRQELDNLYGPGEAIQTGWYYDFDEFALTLANCDLILDIDPNGQFADPEGATELVRTLLPEDAVLAGAWEFGTIQTAPQDADEWLSATLAARYRILGEPRTGAILVLYTYAGNAMSPGSISHIELRAATIPE
jgi:hypothetical protein